MARVDNQNQIKDYMQRLANAAPDIYQQLIEAVQRYVIETMESVVESQTDEILVAKGKALQARKFLQLLTEKPRPTQ